MQMKKGKEKETRQPGPFSQHQNNSLFKPLASELAVSHQERKESAVPLRTPSLHKGQRSLFRLPRRCLPGHSGPYILLPLLADYGVIVISEEGRERPAGWQLLPRQGAVIEQEPRSSCTAQNSPPQRTGVGRGKKKRCWEEDVMA